MKKKSHARTQRQNQRERKENIGNEGVSNPVKSVYRIHFDGEEPMKEETQINVSKGRMCEKIGKFLDVDLI